MRQSGVMSLVEAVANVAVGYGVAVLVQIAIFPVFGIAVTLKQNLSIGLVFTLVSLGRSYASAPFREWAAARIGVSSPP